MRDDFSQSTKSVLSRRVGFKCSNPDCQHLTDGPAIGAKTTVSIGEAAHICAAAPGGPRYDATMTSEERSSYENGIWLCRNCAAMIDRDELHYTVAQLHQWKEGAEKRAEDALHKGLQSDGADASAEYLTDDEKIVLYYLLSKEQVAVSKGVFSQWCIDAEIYDVNYDNARLLLPTVEDKSEIQLEVAKFRDLLRQKDKKLLEYNAAVENHKRLSSYTIRGMWDRFSPAEQLLIAYSKDTNSRSLGDRWKAQGEIEAIQHWQRENGLDEELSSGYGDALYSLIENEVLYPTDWTSYGNAREYSYHKSAWDFIRSGSLDNEIKIAKTKHLNLQF